MKLDLKINSAYLCVKDMNRAIDFYEKLLGHEVNLRDKVFSVFVHKGFRLCLFNPKEVNESVKWGDNCLLSFEANDIDLIKKKLKELKTVIVYPPTHIGQNTVLEFRDPEGNDIEVYSKRKSF